MNRTYTPAESFEERLLTVARKLEVKARRIPPGKHKDAFLSKAKQVKVALEVNQWISSGHMPNSNKPNVLADGELKQCSLFRESPVNRKA